MGKHDGADQEIIGLLHSIYSAIKSYGCCSLNIVDRVMCCDFDDFIFEM